MSRRRPRLAECRNMDDFVRGGFAQVLSPTTADSGYKSYGPGRLFLPAAHGSNDVGVRSDLRYPTAPLPALTSGTVAFRMQSFGWAGNDGVKHELFYVRDLADSAYTVAVYKQTDNKWYVAVRGGSAVTLASAALSFAANTPHVIVVRWTQGASGTLDLNYDGTNAAQAAQAQTLTPGAWLQPCGYYGSATMGPAYVGPMLLSPGVRKSDAWTDAIVAGGGAAFSDPARLLRDFMDTGDVLYPLAGDSRSYPRVQGSGLPFDMGRLVFDGDSLTSGHGVTPTYPDQCNPAGWWKKVNLGVGGDTIDMMAAAAAATVDPLLVTTLYDPSILIVQCGTNPGANTPAQNWADMVTYLEARRTAGWERIVVNTIPSYVTEGEDRSAYNTLIRENWSDYADALADIAADPRIGDDGDYADLTYFLEDQVHMTSTGYGVVAPIVAAAIESLL